MALEEAFGIVLKELRQNKSISQEKLALDCGLDRTFISLLERGQRQPSLSTIFQLATSLNIKASEIVELVDKKISSNNV